MKGKRLRITCSGAVQGVGFRPYIHRLARSLDLTGWVKNSPEGAVMEVEGDPESVRAFVESLVPGLPPLARLDRMEQTPVPTEQSTVFEVIPSESRRRESSFVPPDAALCGECRDEMEERGNRREYYPFTTCTDCGPRYSLVRELPYDRERTSMACFPLCPDCMAEYTNPSDRRFHAEPLCCPACGPRIRLLDPSGREAVPGNDALGGARRVLEEGSILALKGLGGFQLACRADRDEPVSVLRNRKRRPFKPFAVMVRDPVTARSCAVLNEEDEALMRSFRSPIVLAPKTATLGLSGQVAPGIGDIGLMLPTTPLHVELFRDSAYDALVMTSGNVSDEPICRDNREALKRLGPLADFFLVHDRDVVRRVDDSVVRSEPSGSIVVRRSRGYVPEPLPLPERLPKPVLALGGHLQNTVCLGAGTSAVLSQHVGDLDNDPARTFLKEAADCLESFLQVRAEVLCTDLHPDYPSTWIGEEMAAKRGAELLRIQHHLAHAAAVMGEHGIFPEPGERVGAVILDGTGWGPDGTAWGGEWLLVDGNLAWTRAGRLKPIPLVGGEIAVKEPWRVLLAALAQENRESLFRNLPAADFVEGKTRDILPGLVAGQEWPLASGAGRLFEAGGALLGLTGVNHWEGEAAVRFETAASAWREPVEDWEEVTLEESGDGWVLPGSRLLAAAAERTLAGEAHEKVAAGFHAAFCRLAADLAVRVIGKTAGRIVLGGGCLVNRLLAAGLSDRLTRAGYEVYRPGSVPPGDGGISYGQAVLASAALGRSFEILLKG